MVDFNFIKQPLLRIHPFLMAVTRFLPLFPRSLPLTPVTLLLVMPQILRLSAILFLLQLTIHQIADDVVAILAFIDLALGHQTGLHSLDVLGLPAALHLGCILLGFVLPKLGVLEDVFFVEQLLLLFAFLFGYV